MAALSSHMDACKTIVGAAKLLAIAAALGFAFNSVSPLGVRFHAGVKADATNSAVAVVPQTNIAPETTTVATQTNPPAVPSVGERIRSSAPVESAVKEALTWLEVKPLLAAKKIVLVDARATESFDAGHIPDAVSLPDSSTPDKFEKFKATYALDTPLVVYCSSSDCDQSTELAKALKTKHGYTHVQHMPGGYAEWRAAEENPTQPAAQ